MTTKNRLGPRVVGDERAAEEAESEKATIGGQHVLGPRVTGLLHAVPSTARQAANNTKLGHRVTDESKPTDLSVDEIRDLLHENSTFFDSLYIGELHRKGGPRVAALRVFKDIEANSKEGQARPYIIDEINSLLGINESEDENFVSKQIEARRQAYEEMQSRQEKNQEKVEATQSPATTEARVSEIMHEGEHGESQKTATKTSHTRVADPVEGGTSKTNSEKTDVPHGTSGTTDKSVSHARHPATKKTSGKSAK